MEILSEEEKKAIEKALKDAEIVRAEIAKAKRAGIDVSSLEARLHEAELALQNLKRVYLTKR